jgi:hypothetical protein
MDPHEWSYLAEGGANIVFKYIANNEKYVKLGFCIRVVFSNLQKGKILRIRKSTAAEQECLIELLQVYHVYLMNLLSLKPLEMELISLKRDFVSTLVQSCDHLRPEHRKHSKNTEVDEYRAFLMTSLIDHESYTCEIKVGMKSKPPPSLL